MEARDRYLERVAEHLPVPAGLRSEILEELAAHLGDSVGDLTANGREPAAAEAEALARLGPPDALARALVSAHRSRARVLAAAGAGTLAAIRSGALAAIAGWLLIVLVSILGAIVLQIVGSRLGLALQVSWFGGWNTVLVAVGLGAGAFAAGSVAVRTVAGRSWFAPSEVRAAVALVGGAAVAVLVLVVIEQPQNWASVIALLLVPVAFAVGTRMEGVRLPSTSIAAIALLGGGVVVLTAGLASAAGSSSARTAYSWDERAVGYEMIAPWWQDPATGEALDFPSGESFSGAPDVESVTVFAASPEDAARFSDYRLEAWRAEAPGDGWHLTPGQSGPFAKAPATVEDVSIQATLRFDTAPTVEWAELALTAVGPDGRRYLVSATGPVRTEFYGSVWSWFAALAVEPGC